MFRNRRRPFAAVCVLVCAALLASAGCSSSPKRKRRTVLMTEYDDARVGKEVAGDVRVLVSVGLLVDGQRAAH